MLEKQLADKNDAWPEELLASDQDNAEQSNTYYHSGLQGVKASSCQFATKPFNISSSFQLSPEMSSATLMTVPSSAALRHEAISVGTLSAGITPVLMRGQLCQLGGVALEALQPPVKR